MGTSASEVVHRTAILLSMWYYMEVSLGVGLEAQI